MHLVVQPHLAGLLRQDVDGVWVTQGMIDYLIDYIIVGKHALERPAGAVPIFPCRHWLVRELRNQPVSCPGPILRMVYNTILQYKYNNTILFAL